MPVSSSSDSSTTGAGEAVAEREGSEMGCRGGIPDAELSTADNAGEGEGAVAGSSCGFSRTGGRSVVECLPAVQGGMDRNSSKVSTRGLQHFQPVPALAAGVAHGWPRLDDPERGIAV